MKYSLRIKNNATGESRVYKDDYDWAEEYLFRYQYTEGNYSCDCNRAIFFADGTDEDDECECGDDVAFSIIWVEDEDGARFTL